MWQDDEPPELAAICRFIDVPISPAAGAHRRQRVTTDHHQSAVFVCRNIFKGKPLQQMYMYGNA